MLKLYYAPGACSLSDHIALLETGLPFEIVKVDLHAKLTEKGGDFLAVNPKGYVPALVFENGDVLTENVAVLDWIAGRFPPLAVEGALGRSRLLEVLAFVSAELHVRFGPFWHGGTSGELAAARDMIVKRLSFLAGTMRGGYLFGPSPTVADFYLFVMLRWAKHFDIPIPASLLRLMDRLRQRPSVQAALNREGLDL